MQSRIYSYIISFVVIALCAVALSLAFGLPMRAEASCEPTYTYSPCVDVYNNPPVYTNYYGNNYGNPSGYYNGYSGNTYQTIPEHLLPRYVYYQDPSYYARQTYQPVIYPIPVYVQTGRNPAGTNYGSNPVYSNPTYVQNNYGYNGYGNTYGTGYGTSGYGSNYGNTYGGNNYGGSGGFTLSGGSQTNSSGGVTSGGFINMSGR